MVWIRKARAGSDSHGFVWEHDGAVVDVPPTVAGALLAIPDGGFSEAVGPHDPDEAAEKEPAPLVDLDALAAAVEERMRARDVEPTTVPPADEQNASVPSTDAAAPAGASSRGRKRTT